jgi:hypothetical protein
MGHHPFPLFSYVNRCSEHFLTFDTADNSPSGLRYWYVKNTNCSTSFHCRLGPGPGPGPALEHLIWLRSATASKNPSALPATRWLDNVVRTCFFYSATCLSPGLGCGPDSDWLRAGRSGDRIPVGARFSAPIQTDPGTHPASCTMGTGSFPGVKSGRGVTLTPHLLLVSWSWKSGAISLLPLWAVRPVQSLIACTSVHVTLQ